MKKLFYLIVVILSLAMIGMFIYASVIADFADKYKWDTSSLFSLIFVFVVLPAIALLYVFTYKLLSNGSN